MLVVPECVKRIWLTESFHQIYALVSLARIFQLCKLFLYTLYIKKYQCLSQHWGTGQKLYISNIYFPVKCANYLTGILSNKINNHILDRVKFRFKLVSTVKLGPGQVHNITNSEGVRFCAMFTIIV